MLSLPAWQWQGGVRSIFFSWPLIVLTYVSRITGELERWGQVSGCYPLGGWPALLWVHGEKGCPDEVVNKLRLLLYPGWPGPKLAFPIRWHWWGQMGEIRAGPGQLSKTRGLRTLPRDGQKEEWKPTEPAGEVGFRDKAEAPCKHPTKVEETQEKLSVILEKGASVQNRQASLRGSKVQREWDQCWR